MPTRWCIWRFGGMQQHNGCIHDFDDPVIEKDASRCNQA